MTLMRERERERERERDILLPSFKNCILGEGGGSNLLHGERSSMFLQCDLKVNV